MENCSARLLKLLKALATLNQVRQNCSGTMSLICILTLSFKCITLSGPKSKLNKILYLFSDPRDDLSGMDVARKVYILILIVMKCCSIPSFFLMQTCLCDSYVINMVTMYNGMHLMKAFVLILT